MNNQRVSIITPVKNGAQFLVECLDSIVNQTHQNWELLIVNDS
ncbi:MAG: glycosyltransferase involved in cell wall biosynthesis, partial [Flavobacteriales bacterium]